MSSSTTTNVRMTTMTTTKVSSATATTMNMNPPSLTTPGSLTSRAFFGKMSSSSTSSISSSYSSLIANENLNNVQLPINPFEETNKFRLEQSVLSPNLFHVASTSTPEVNFLFHFVNTYTLSIIYFISFF